jgi:hypothetical protein
MRLLEVWVKGSFLRGASILILSECLRQIHPKLCEEFSKDRLSLSICPEREGFDGIVTKLATILRTSNPRDLTVLTMEGSPHCLFLHTSVLQALFLTGLGIRSRHFVVLDGVPLEVRPEAVRIARYLHLVDRLLTKCPEALEGIKELSHEQRKAMEH